MLPQPDLNHDLKNKIWAALEALKLFMKKSSISNLSLLLRAQTALEQSLDLLEGNKTDTTDNLDKMVSTSLVDLFPVAHGRGIKLDIRSTKTALQVQMDKFSFLRIIHNLVLNAVEAADSEVIVQSGYWTDDYGQTFFPSVSVRNDGKGIHAENLPLIFHRGISSKGSKRGYGLHIVRNLLQNNGKLILFTSDNETTFFVVFNHNQENEYA